VSLRFTFQTSAKYYLTLEYGPVGELFYHMDHCGTIPFKNVRLYVAEIGLVLSYLDLIEIIYPDLKSKNVFLI
jgi:serine/threonine protein kinase